MEIKKTVPFLINAGKLRILISANNKNKYNPQEHAFNGIHSITGANNKNKYNPQERERLIYLMSSRANNKNKYNPQELFFGLYPSSEVQIIRINTILKNNLCENLFGHWCK